LAYHIREGAYGDVRLDGLNVLAVSQFDGNIWAGEARRKQVEITREARRRLGLPEEETDENGVL
jgi:hypothetical protein